MKIRFKLIIVLIMLLLSATSVYSVIANYI